MATLDHDWFTKIPFSSTRFCWPVRKCGFDAYKSMFRHVEPVVTPIRDFCGVVVRIEMRGMHAEYSESQSSNETFVERIFAMHFHVVACYPGASRAPL